MQYRGGCHCGAVAFEVEGELSEVNECNCSICLRKAYLHWIVPQQTFRLLTGEESLGVYTFNTGVARHFFCIRCGVAPYYVPRSNPDKIDVNARCLDGVDLSGLRIRKFDGRNWEQAMSAGQLLPGSNR
ncbi:MAG TPA: GFA family protein [Candidatus Binataceae bacterium]|nr:GFA family protein [Candidatus Binataceae bacterium]